MKSKTKILIVDDEDSFVDLATKVLKEDNYTVHSVNNAEDAMKKILKNEYSLMITDLILPGTDGLKLLEKIKVESPNTDVIFCTNYSGVESAIKALKAGANDYLIKPIEMDSLRFIVKKCMEQRNLYDENVELKKIVDLIAACKNISSTFDVNKISKYALDILTKETGASSAFFLAYSADEKKTLEVLNAKGIAQNKVKKLFELFSETSKRWKKSKSDLIKAKEDELAMVKFHYKTIHNFTVVNIRVKNEVKAFIILLNDKKRGDFTDSDLKNLDFIIREISLAFSNFEQYTVAKELAYIDDLTNLYNSRYLYLILDREIKRAKRFKSSLVVLFIDLDKFKEVNDAHGHLAGGKVLIEMASVLLDCVREIDTVVRYGGDEYIVVLTETNIKSGRMVAERIRQNVEKHVFLEDEKINIKLTACIGIAAYPKHAATKKELIHFADMAMYMGKETTKNAVYVAAERLQ
ncbi:diguanylate cyclase [Thermodesulfobacteriota bacterium]